MQYYSLHEGVEKIGRTYPQSQNIEMELGKTVNDENFIWNVCLNSSPTFIPYTGKLILNKGASVTDFISSAIISNMFVCNNKVRDIISKFNTKNLNYYDVGIKHRDINYINYKILHCYNDYTNLVDYKNSNFAKTRIENNIKVYEKISIGNLENFKSLRMELSKNNYGEWNSVVPFQIKFLDNSFPEYDIFNIRGFTHKTFVSQRLKVAFENSKVTGVMFDFYGEHIDFD